MNYGAWTIRSARWCFFGQVAYRNQSRTSKYIHVVQSLNIKVAGNNTRRYFCKDILTLILPIATIIPDANNLDPDETPSSSASHLDPSCLTLGQQFC